MGFGGGRSMKNMALKEESKLKILGLKGHHRKNSLKFSSDSICNNANSLPVCQKPAFLTLRKFRFSRGSMPLDLYFSMYQKAILTH